MANVQAPFNELREIYYHMDSEWEQNSRIQFVIAWSYIYLFPLPLWIQNADDALACISMKMCHFLQRPLAWSDKVSIKSLDLQSISTGLYYILIKLLAEVICAGGRGYFSATDMTLISHISVFRNKVSTHILNHN